MCKFGPLSFFVCGLEPFPEDGSRIASAKPAPLGYWALSGSLANVLIRPPDIDGYGLVPPLHDSEASYLRESAWEMASRASLAIRKFPNHCRDGPIGLSAAMDDPFRVI